MIPSTGVTLPLVSYGGSSILGTIIVFSIIQGITVLARSQEKNAVNESDVEDVTVGYSDFTDNNKYKTAKKAMRQIKKK